MPHQDDKVYIDPLSPPKVDANPGGYIGPGASLERLVDSRMFVTLARVLMIIASAVGLPIAGSVLVRVMNAADRIVEKVDAQGVSLLLLEQSLKQMNDRNMQDVGQLRFDLKDHEGRIRVLERLPGNLPSRPN